MAERFGLVAVPVRALGLRDASDEDIYVEAARPAASAGVAHLWEHEQ
jgi:hypothetical protein